MVAGVCNVNDALDGHVSLDLECLDRIYLNAYVPNLQVGGQVVGFLTQHLGNPIPSPATFTKLGNSFRAAVERFAATHEIPVIRFAKDARKADVMRPYLKAATEPGVVAIGVAQEFQNVFCGWKRKTTTPGAVSFAFAKADRRVSVYYCYVLDRDFGPGFIKLCSYFPYPAKVWVNGHEWAKRQAATAGIAFTELANGFATCDDPAALQAICDRLGPADIQRFFDRWLARIPTRWGWPTRPPATGGSCRCARSRCPAPWSWTSPARPGRSLRRWSPTTSTSAAPTRSSSSSAAASAKTPRAALPPRS